MSNDREEVLTGGVVNEVVRVGDTVRRPTGPWNPGRMLRELADAVADSVPPPDAIWRTEPMPGAVTVRHGDVGPWNTIWDGERLVGLIDWDSPNRPHRGGTSTRPPGMRSPSSATRAPAP